MKTAAKDCKLKIENCKLQIGNWRLPIPRQTAIRSLAICILQFAILNSQFSICPAVPPDRPPDSGSANAPASQRPAVGAAPAPATNPLAKFLPKVPPPPPPDPAIAAPPPGNPMKIPLANGVHADRVEIQVYDGLISL